MAGAAVIGGRLVVWLARHPMTSVFVLLVVVAAFTASVVSLVSGSSSEVTQATAGAPIEPYMLPAPTQHPPKDRVNAAHKALHALGRACETARAQRQPGTMRPPLELIEAFAVDFPSGGFRMDGEPGTTLALLIVVWDELKGCSPPRVPEVERLIPISYRGN